MIMYAAKGIFCSSWYLDCGIQKFHLTCVGMFFCALEKKFIGRKKYIFTNFGILYHYAWVNLKLVIEVKHDRQFSLFFLSNILPIYVYTYYYLNMMYPSIGVAFFVIGFSVPLGEVSRVVGCSRILLFMTSLGLNTTCHIRNYDF